MGKNYAEYMAEKFPGKKVALITGLLEHLPVQMITGVHQAGKEWWLCSH
jgi:hypothetical protein